jgi:hypothetical protein
MPIPPTVHESSTPVVHTDPAGSAQAAPSNARTNRLAIYSLVTGLSAFVVLPFGCLAAIVLGHIALKQIRVTGEAGFALACVGLVLGYGQIALGALVLLIMFKAG